MLYPDILDEQYEFQFRPEVSHPYPLIYVFIVRDAETGTIIPFDENTLQWGQYPQVGSDSLNNVDRVLLKDTIYTGVLNIKELVAKSGKQSGLFLLSIHLVEQTDLTILLEREQSEYLYIFENGLKPPSLP